MGKAATDDPSKEAVYDWEDEWYDWNENILSLRECRLLIRAACAKFGLAPPTVVQHKTNSFSYCAPALNKISIQAVGSKPTRGGKNPATALHEAAHFIAYKLHGERIQDHGPTFLGIYMWLLDQAKIAPKRALEATARSHGLKWKIKTLSQRSMANMKASRSSSSAVVLQRPTISPRFPRTTRRA